MVNRTCTSTVVYLLTLADVLLTAAGTEAMPQVHAAAVWSLAHCLVLHCPEKGQPPQPLLLGCLELLPGQGRSYLLKST